MRFNKDLTSVLKNKKLINLKYFFIIEHQSLILKNKRLVRFI
jgi:hypothetical protein